ncbi:hypothetical protein U1Q18_050102 [Sarracenia purpurea var. burkii]
MCPSNMVSVDVDAELPETGSKSRVRKMNMEKSTSPVLDVLICEDEGKVLSGTNETRELVDASEVEDDGEKGSTSEGGEFKSEQDGVGDAGDIKVNFIESSLGDKMLDSPPIVNTMCCWF